MSRSMSPESLAVDLGVFRAAMVADIINKNRNNPGPLPDAVNDLNEHFQEDVVRIRRDQRRRRQKAALERRQQPTKLVLLVKGQRPPYFGRPPTPPPTPRLQPQQGPLPQPPNLSLNANRKTPSQLKLETIARAALAITPPALGPPVNPKPGKKLIDLGGGLKLWIYDTGKN